MEVPGSRFGWRRTDQGKKKWCTSFRSAPFLFHNHQLNFVLSADHHRGSPHDDAATMGGHVPQSSCRHATNQHGRRTFCDGVRWSYTHAHIANAGCRHACDEHRRCALGDRSAHMGHWSWIHHRTCMHVADSCTWWHSFSFLNEERRETSEFCPKCQVKSRLLKKNLAPK